jgi:5-methyltetrahydropteroyltriglutamate--homocysteine methyltransferase
MLDDAGIMPGMNVAGVRSKLDLLRVDHTGGFRKPDQLREVYLRFAQGQATDQEVRQIQDESVRALIAQEEAHQLPVLSDGEYRRRQFQESFGEAVSGFNSLPGAVYVGGPAEAAPTRRVESGPSGPGPAVLHRLPTTRRLQLVRNVPLEEYQFAAPLTQRPVKVALVGPDRVSQRFEWENSADVYAGLDDFVDDVVQLQRQMVSELVDAGCPYIQLDEPGYTAYVDNASLERMRARGEDPARNLERSVAADNAVLEGFPASVTFGIHICRGGGAAGYHRDGRYETIAEQLFNQLRCQRLLLEYDTEQSGGFEPLRFVPKGTVAVLGLISTRDPEVESIDALQRRIEEAIRYLPLEQLALGPRCGLGLPEEAIWRKVDVMLETAARVWCGE